MLAAVPARAFELCDSAAKLAEFNRALTPWRTALQEKRYADLERHFGALLAAHEAGTLSDALVNRWFRVFETARVGNEPLHLEWITLHPKSQAAYLALGAYLVDRGFSARGGDLASGTSELQFRAMGDAFRKAIAAFDRADTLSRKPTITMAHRMRISTASGIGPKATELYQKALKEYPDTLQVRIRYIWASNPKWGGSIPQLTAIAEQTRNLSKDDQRYIQYLVFLELGSALETAKDPVRAVQVYERSIALCPGFDDGIEDAMRIYRRDKNFAALLPLVEQYIGRYPRSGWAYSTRGWARYFSGNVPDSFTDYAKAVELGYGPAFEGLAWYYETGTVVSKNTQRAIELYMTADSHRVRGAKEKAERLRSGKSAPPATLPSS